MRLVHDSAERVKNGLKEAITLLCKTGLNFQSELSIDGLLGITLDNNEVFLVSIKEVIKNQRDFEVSTSSDRCVDLSRLSDSEVEADDGCHMVEDLSVRSQKRKTSQPKKLTQCSSANKAPSMPPLLNIPRPIYSRHLTEFPAASSHVGKEKTHWDASSDEGSHVRHIKSEKRSFSDALELDDTHTVTATDLSIKRQNTRMSPSDTIRKPAPSDTIRKPAPSDTIRKPAPSDTIRKPAPSWIQLPLSQSHCHNQKDSSLNPVKTNACVFPNAEPLDQVNERTLDDHLPDKNDPKSAASSSTNYSRQNVEADHSEGAVKKLGSFLDETIENIIEQSGEDGVADIKEDTNSLSPIPGPSSLMQGDKEEPREIAGLPYDVTVTERESEVIMVKEEALPEGSPKPDDFSDEECHENMMEETALARGLPSTLSQGAYTYPAGLSTVPVADIEAHSRWLQSIAAYVQGGPSTSSLATTYGLVAAGATNAMLPGGHTHHDGVTIT